jgi:hypothetical protein
LGLGDPLLSARGRYGRVILLVFTGCCSCDCREARCGNGTREPPEECDGSDLDDGCPSGTGAACRADCTVDLSGCASCGNGVAEGIEPCDGADLRGSTCEALGFEEGTLGCTGCALETTPCSSCGDGLVSGTEDCDGDPPSEASCASLGFDSGTLGCTAGCAYDTSACVPLNPAALAFDGIDDVLVCPALDLGLPLAEHTWEAWLWVDATGTSPGTIFEKWTALGCIGVPSTDISLNVFWSNDLVTRWAALCPNCGCFWAAFAAPPPGGWHHVSFALGPDGLGGLQQSIVVDGAFARTMSIPFPDTSWLDDSTVEIRMGNDACEQGTCAPFKGKLDEVRLWSYARTPAEVAADYATQLTGAEGGLVAYWPFEEASGQSTLEVVSGASCDLGGTAAVEASDPVWDVLTPF